MAKTKSNRRRLVRVRSFVPWIVAAAFSISGVVHLAHPKTFTAIVPHFLPWATGLVYASGAAELICAFGLWRRQRWAGIAAVALLVVVWPANLQDALSARHVVPQVLLGIRFPLQIPLMWCAWQSGRIEAESDRP